MKFTLSKEVSTYVALAAAIVSGATTLLLMISGRTFFLIIPITSMIVTFALVYIITKSLLKRVIPESSNITTKEVIIISENKPEEADIVYSEAKTSIRSQIREIDRLKEMERYRKEYLGNVSHELKTPVFNIQGYILTLLDGGLEDPSINRKYLERAEKSTNRLISIIEDLETISRLESGELKLDKEEFNIVQLIEEIFEAQEVRAKKKEIKLVFDKKYKKPILVYADKMRIFQVLTNLTSNSIYYGKNGGKTKVSITDEGDKVLIDVNDNGIGIAQEDIPRVFERFYRVDKSRSRDQGGTGLGLAIVKHIIEGHNEMIKVKSKLGKGSSFIFSLPKSSNEVK